MLTSTFIHLPGIGLSKERALWESKVLEWDDFERTLFGQHSFEFDGSRPGSVRAVLDQSRKALESDSLEFFTERLPRAEHYRIALARPDLTCFLDIETTGLSHYYDEATIIGVGTTSEYRFFVRGQSDTELVDYLSQFKCIVTFNGTLFDLKFLKREYANLRLPHAHVDLRFLARRVGLTGGQKQIESALKIKRSASAGKVIGEHAPILWHQYRMGDLASAERLIEYNRADVLGMRVIFDHVATTLLKKIKFPTPRQTIAKFSESIPNTRSSWVLSPNIGPYSGHSGPKATYRSVTSRLQPAALRVVGIDLTGSEKRDSGWCLLEGTRSETKRICTDRELIELTIAAQPTLVSIDSPLSLPRGRKRVTDDDDGREQFGIMRECERVLKRRGVNVYPSLIPSMQALTARGIRLATALRRQGIAVIESYPGAAQDIMGIPRKRKGLEYLTHGLRDFGIVGDYLVNQVSHDELDAITSAIVGVFFWAGKFEALGNDEEDYLIIPDLTKSGENWRRRKIVGLSGPISAGKTSAARLAERLGFAYARYSEVISALVRTKGGTPTRESLQSLGWQIHNDLGQRWLGKQLIKHIADQQRVVIDGLRFAEDRAFLVESFGPSFLHVHIDAPIGIRRSRYAAEGYSQGEFDVANSHEVETEVAMLAKLAVKTVVNDTSMDMFSRQVNHIVGAALDQDGAA